MQSCVVMRAQCLSITNVKLLEGILAGKEEADQRVIGINIPVQPQTSIGPMRPIPTALQDVVKKTDSVPSRVM